MNIDHTCVQDHRVYIRHLSAKNIDILQDLVSKVLDHCWNKLGVDTVRVDLKHFEDPNKPEQSMQADKDVKEVLVMNKRGFKWRQLINRPDSG